MSKNHCILRLYIEREREGEKKKKQKIKGSGMRKGSKPRIRRKM